MNDKSNDKPKESIGEMVRSFVFAVLIALVFRSVAYEPFHIPSGSMLSTLYEGDYIFVSKFSYGYTRFSFPFGFKFFEGRIFETAPQRGDVVVFRPPGDIHTDFIKRVIGLPGDTIQVKHGHLFINNEAVEVTRDGDVTVENRCKEISTLKRYNETLPGGRVHTILEDHSCLDQFRDPVDADNTAVYTVPPKHYFMMGDNRNNSRDSRFEKPVGYVPEENIIGRADRILLSYDTAVPLWKIWQWPSAFRNDRWFRRID